ncbi:MAG: hypothetical protein C4519_19090 [Desulfobacteraceae bacterium]|nr:MAG: hypothetical protein C4519_19090 [Desulfobacteraceae bacterium]
MKTEGGFVLIELMIAVMILTIGILGLMSMQVKAIQVNSSARRITQSSTLGADRFEKLMSLPYADAQLQPDTTITVVDGRYTIEWEVLSANTPIPNIKTINVTVSCIEAGQPRSISYVYYKADQI